MATNLETIRRIKIEAQVSGVEQATARLNDTSRAIGTMEGAVARARRAYDPLFTATERLAAVQRTATLAVAAGNLTQEEASRLYEQAANKITGYGRELERVTRLEIQARAAREASARAVAQANQGALNQRLGVGAGPARDYEADFRAAAIAADALQGRLVPLIGIQQRYLAVLAEIGGAQRAGIITTEQAIDARVREAASYQRNLDTIERTKAAAAAANQTAINQRFGIGAAPSRDAAADFQAAATAADNLRARYSPLFAAQRQYLAALAEIKEASKAGILTENERAAALERTKAAFAAQVTGIRGSEGGGNGRLNAYQAQNLFYQGTDVVASLASGMPLSTIALQQGGQIAPTFMGPGGASVRGIASQAGDALGGLAARIGIAGGALGAFTTALVAAGAAGLSYAASQKELERSLIGRGRASGSTADQINRIANENAGPGNVSVRQAREMGAEFANTGRIGSEMYGSLIRSARDYAATTGQELPGAQKALAEAFADPANGASALNKQLGFLNATSAESIERLARQGDRLGAQRALMDAYSTSLTKARDLTSGWGVVTEAVGNTVSDMWDKIGKAVANSFTGGETLEARLTEARRLLAEAQGAQGGVVDRLTGNATSEAQRLQGVIGGLQAQIAQRDAQNAAARRNQRDIEIKSLVDGYNQSGQALKRLEDDAKNVARALREGVLDPEGRSLRTMTALQEAARQIKSDMAAGGAAYADAVRAAGFENRNVGTTGVALQRAQIEEQAQNKSIAATRDTQDASDLFAKLQSIEVERVTRLNTLLKETENQAANAGGALARVSGSLREQIIGAARGSVTPGIIAGIANKESSNNPNVGFSRSLGEDGRPSSAYGLGQITKGTAEEAVRRGYLPQGFDRTDTSTMAQGIAGVLAMKIDQAGGDVTAGLMAYRGSKDASINRAYAAEVMRKAGQFGDVSSTGLVKDQDALNRGQRDAAENLKNLTRNYGENGAALELEAARRQKYNELLDRGVPAAEAASIAFSGMTDKIVQLGRSAKEIQFQRDLEFERAQLGRSSLDQSVYSQVRSRYGDTTSAEAQGAIGNLREIGMMKEARGAFQDTFGGVVSSLSRGSTAAQAFSQALSRLGDKLITMGTDALGGLLFGGGKGGGGGILGSLVSSLAGGAGGIDAGVTSWMPKFADGGMLSGPGGPRSDNLLVRASPGEYIVNAESASKYRSMLDAINSSGLDSLHRFAEGGMVPYGPSVESLSARAYAYVPPSGGASIASQSSYTNAPVISIDARGSNLTEAQIHGAVVQALAANNLERDRTQFERSEAYRRMAG